MQTNFHLGFLLARIAIGFPMLIYGISKLIHGIDFIKGMLADLHLPEAMAYGVYVGEVLAPIALLLGFKTRLAAAVFAFNCLTAILMAQLPNLFRLNDFGGWAMELLVIYMLVAVGLFFTGGGKFAVTNKSLWD